MRRTSSALTTTILGAIIMASTVSAQQFLPSASSRRGSAAAAASASEFAPAPDSATAPAPPAGSKADPVFGMAASRGARYLLRNGLDYLNYQEYERALKYFREAEIRQTELNEAEKLSLKQGIERAQRGLREAVGSETPYALSKRSRRAGGFAAAKPDSQIAATSSSATQPRSAAATPRITNREGDEQGEPVRLARAEIANSSASTPAAVASPEPIPGEMPKPLPLTSDQPAQLPEIPKLPQVSETADLPGAGAQTSSGTTTEAAHTVPLAGNDGQQNQAMASAPTGLAFPEQAKLHEALRQPLPSVAAAPVSTPSDAPAAVPGIAKLDTAAPVPGVAKLDAAAAAAQADLASPLPTLVPNDQPSVPASRNQDHAAASDPAASAEVPLLTQTQPKSEPNVGDKPGDPPPSLSLDPAVAPSASASAEAIAAAQNPATAQTASETPRTSKPTSDLTDAKGKASPSADKAVEAAALPATTAESEPSLTPPAPINLETPADSSNKPAPAPAPAPAPVPGPAPTPAAPTTPAPTPMPEQRSADPDSIPLPPLGNEVEQPTRNNQDRQPSTKTSEPAPATAPARAESVSTTAPTVAAVTEELPSLPQSGNHESDRTTKAEPLPPPADDLPPLPAAGPAPASAATAPEAMQPLKATSPAPVPEVISTPSASSDVTNQAATRNPATVSLEARPTETPELKPASEPLAAPARATEAAGASLTTTAGSPATEPREPLPAAASTIPAQEAPNPAAIPSGTLIGEPAATAHPNFEVRQDRGPDSFIPQRANAASTLRPELKRQVEEIARMQEDDLRRRQAQPAAPPTPREGFSDLRSQTQTNVDISRAPSPAEARPIRAIPVPEDWVPLARREWTPQSKYWAAAATCHMPLYFQDPMLERYGHSVEHFLGPTGRYLAYPVDDHTQTTQRNQMAQPFFSVGLFAFQIIAWPYNLIMDPPWEAQYDLGYWRPGDKIPTDLYYMPLHGIGPPLRGRNY